jgi:hypothetical protein
MRFNRAWPFGALAAMLVLSIGISLGTARPANIGSGDAPDYLTTAYHIAYHHVFARDANSSAALPGIGREPVYPSFLAALMLVDPGLGRFEPGCAGAATRCNIGSFPSASIANLVLVELSGIFLFFIGYRITGSASAGLVAAGYTLLNVHMNRFWQDPVSDRLAMFLVTATMLALTWAWGTRRRARWILFAVFLAALTLTKAAFLPFSIGAGLASMLWLLSRPTDAARKFRILGTIALVYGLFVGGWVMRNLAVSGELRITDNRGGVVLSTREALLHMTPTQYLASFVYWTRGPGPGLARRLFGPEVIAPFELERPDGFFAIGQNGYNGRVDALMRAENLDFWAASAKIDREVIGSIFTHPIAYAATSLPVLYRGIWIDEFALVGIPAFLLATWAAWRRREILKLLLLSVGVYNEAFHVLISLNIPRYQITAMPSVAIAVSIAFAALLRRFSLRASGIGLSTASIRQPAVVGAFMGAAPPASSHSVTLVGQDRKAG